MLLVAPIISGHDRNAEVRVVLAQLKKLAEDFNVAIILVTHLNKIGSSDASVRVTGSTGLLAAARAGWLLTKDDTELRMVSLIKTNLTENRAGFTFVIEFGRVEIANYEVDMSADEVLQAESDARADQSKQTAKARNAAAEWLREFLTGGRKPAGSEFRSDPGTVHYESQAVGYAWKTIYRAAASLGVRKPRESGVSYWELPDDQG